MIEFRMICDICGVEGHISKEPSEACVKALKAAASKLYGQELAANQRYDSLVDLARRLEGRKNGMERFGLQDYGL